MAQRKVASADPPLTADPSRTCECGCGVSVRRRYAPGHASSHRARLRREARAAFRMHT